MCIRDRYRTNLQTILVEQLEIKRGINSNNAYFERFIKYKNVEQLDRVMLIELIKRIYIMEDKSIHIEFNFEDQYMLILDYIKENGKEKAVQKVLTKK